MDGGKQNKIKLREFNFNSMQKELFDMDVSM